MRPQRWIVSQFLRPQQQRLQQQAGYRLQCARETVGAFGQAAQQRLGCVAQTGRAGGVKGAQQADSIGGRQTLGQGDDSFPGFRRAGQGQRFAAGHQQAQRLALRHHHLNKRLQVRIH